MRAFQSPEGRKPFHAQAQFFFVRQMSEIGRSMGSINDVKNSQLRRTAAIALVALSVAALALNAWYWTNLPNRIATHFNVRGRPDGWMDKTKATWLMVALQLGLPWLLVGMGEVIRYLPTSLINIPRREYWLHTDRREASLAYIRSWIGWVAIAVLLFMMSIGHLTYVANVRGAPLNVIVFGSLLVLYLIGIMLLVVAMVRRFTVPP